MAADYGRTVICIGTGNEGELARHASSVWQENVPEVTELSVSDYQTSFNLQLWKDYEDRVALVVVHPDNRRYALIEGDPGLQQRRLGQTDVLIYYGEPAPYSMQQELYIGRSWRTPIGLYVGSMITGFPPATASRREPYS